MVNHLFCIRVRHLARHVGLIPLSILLLITACRSTPPPPTAATERSRERIAIKLAVSQSEQRRLSPLVDEFEAQHTTIDVQFVTIDSLIDPNSDISFTRQLVTQADVIPASAQRTPERHLLLDLTSFIESDPNFDREDFHPNLLVEDTGAIHTIPTSAAYHIIYYDRAAFDTLGLPYPQNGWTTADFLQTARTLTITDANGDTRWGYLPSVLQFSPLFAAQLDAPLGEAGELRQDVDVLSALQWVAGLFTTEGVSPWLTIYHDFSTPSMSINDPVSRNEVAMWERTNGSYDQHSALVESLGAVAPPAGDDGLYAEPIITGYGISRGTQQAEAAWKLLDFLSRRPPTGRIERFNVPARRSVAEAAGFWQTFPAEIREATRYAAENSQPPRLWYEVWKLVEVFPRMIDDGQSAADALAGVPLAPTPVRAEEAEIVVAAPEPTAESGGTVIRFRVQSHYDTFRALARAFNQEQDSIEVDVLLQDIGQLGVPSDPIESIGDSDCFYYIGWVTEDIADLLVPVEPLLELDPTVAYEDFYPSAWYHLRVDHTLYGLPASVAPLIIVYDRARFEQRGVPLPTQSWSVDDFTAAVQLLTTGEGDDKQYGFFDHSYNMLNSTPAQFPMQFVDHTVTPPTVDFGANAESLMWYPNLTALYQSHPILPIRSDDYGNWMARYGIEVQRYMSVRNYAMWTAHPVQVPEQTELQRENLGVAIVPLGPSGNNLVASQIIPFGYYIFEASEHRQACWEWITFLTGRAAAATDVPPRIDVAQSQEYEARVGVEIASMYRATLEGQRVIEGEQLPAWMQPAVVWRRRAQEQVMHGALIAEELARSQQDWDAYRQCVIDAEAFEDQAAWRACAIEVDITLTDYYD